MKISRQLLQASVGVTLLVLSLPLSFHSGQGFSQKRYEVDAASCRLNVVVLQKGEMLEVPGASEAGSVVLFHGIAANGLIMQYLARSFADLGLRVFIPDLPGHAHSPGPFSPAEAENCSAALLRGLAARGMIDPGHTILAGHSMGAAIALRIAERFRPAGVIAISPAPMEAARGVTPENLLFHGLPKVVPNTRIITGQFEPSGLVANAAALAASANDSSVVFSVVPWNTHVSVLFSPTVARECQAWAARVLSLPAATQLPSRGNLAACLLGLLGILLVAGPFLRDVVGKEPRADSAAGPAAAWWRGAVEVIVISLVAVFVLRYAVPLRFLHLFEGDYLASFFLMVGVVLMLAHVRAARIELRGAFGLKSNKSAGSEPQRIEAGKDAPPAAAKTTWQLVLWAAVGALLLHFLVSSWFELTASSSWLTTQRWLRFPAFFVAAFCYLLGMELLAGPVGQRAWRRFGVWLLLVALSWHSLALAVFHLKSGEILLVLLSPYFALLFLFSGLGIQLVRKLTGSATAAAVFGAILLAGFCLALFPTA